MFKLRAAKRTKLRCLSSEVARNYRRDPTKSQYAASTALEYKALVEGSTPLERTFEMFPMVLNYAPCFERNPEFKKDMDPFKLNRVNGHWEEDDITPSNPVH